MISKIFKKILLKKLLDEFIKKIKKMNLIIMDDELIFLLFDMPVNDESENKNSIIK